MSKTTKAELEEKRATMQRQIEAGNAKMESRYAEAKPKYSKPLVTSAQNAHKLARTLSEKYTTLKFSVCYESGRQSVFAEPAQLSWPTEGSDYNMERNVEGAEKYADAAEAGTYWPAFEIVEAFAVGYDKACASADELAELKRENERLKARLHEMRPPMMMPWHPFFGP